MFWCLICIFEKPRYQRRAIFYSFVSTGLSLCRQDAGRGEDVEMGICLEKLHVIAGNSRDEFGGERFFPLDPRGHLAPDGIPPDNWYWKYTFYVQNKVGPTANLAKYEDAFITLANLTITRTSEEQWATQLQCEI